MRLPFAGTLFRGLHYAGTLFRAGLTAAPPEPVPGGAFRRWKLTGRTLTRPADTARRQFGREQTGRRFWRPYPMSQAEIPARTLPKGAGETVSYLFDFSNFPEVEAADEILSASVPAVSGLTIGTPDVTEEARDGVAAGEGVEVTISGGSAGTTYSVKCLATFESGAIREVRGQIVVS